MVLQQKMMMNWGIFQHNTKSKTVVDDLYEITKEIKSRFGEEIPYFVLGHSMGSFMIRRYIMTYGDKVDGAVIVGTGSQPKVVLKGGKSSTKNIKRPLKEIITEVNL